MCKNHIETHNCRTCGRKYDELKMLVKCDWAWEYEKDFGECFMGIKPTSGFYGGECIKCQDEREAIERVARLEPEAGQAIAAVEAWAKKA
jgi:hypothetical protein